MHKSECVSYSKLYAEIYEKCLQHTTGFIQRKLDHFFISNQLQESVEKTSILAVINLLHYS